MMAKVPVQFTLNGAERAEFVESGSTLLKALRDKIGDISVKGGCQQGTCGSCSVLIDGEIRLSCLTLAETCSGTVVETTAGLAEAACSILSNVRSTRALPRSAASARPEC
jgi:carbon-monoxide dehydrogenase small subunit